MGPCRDLSFTPGRYSHGGGTVNPYGTIPWKSVTVYQQWTNEGSSAYDLAIIELARPVGLQTGWMGYKCAGKAFKSNLAGYPDNKPGSWNTVCTVNEKGCTNPLLQHT